MSTFEASLVRRPCCYSMMVLVNLPLDNFTQKGSSYTGRKHIRECDICRVRFYDPHTPIRVV
ncbi:hypothetical protein HanPSC8_Chr04g0177271 [Helianthus annuus]|nr:hypothetical protein HanPSC8_Chr04g0177271 [Helianthus annuus]